MFPAPVQEPVELPGEPQIHREFLTAIRDNRPLAQADGRDVNRIKAMDDRGRVRIYVDDPQRRRPEPPRRPPTRGDHD